MTIGRQRGDAFLTGSQDPIEGEEIMLLTSAPLSTEGMSGSPVFKARSGELVGILTGRWEPDDPRFRQRLGTDEFNIVRPLGRTLARLR
jgi:hypothetical protein